MFLHALWIMAAEDREQFVVRNKEEPREGVSLGVQVII